MHRVLDLACGPGGWVIEVAFRYSDVMVTGVDISQRMIDYAETMADVQGLDNAFFQVMDIRHPLGFPDATFDFINARFLVGVLTSADWIPVLKECWRVSRPGGFLCLTECDRMGITTNLAFERLQDLANQAMVREGRMLIADHKQMVLTPLLGAFLQEAGWEPVDEQAHCLNFSAGTKAHVSNYRNMVTALTLLQPFVVQTGVTTKEEWKQLVADMQIEMMAPSFRGLIYYLSTWGRKR